MKIKKYDDNTFNIQYDVGDIVKVHHNVKFGEASKDEDKWGKITKITGKPLTAKLDIETVDEKIQVFVWNVKPADEEGKLLTKEEIFSKAHVVEMIQVKLDSINESKKILKFTDI